MPRRAVVHAPTQVNALLTGGDMPANPTHHLQRSRLPFPPFPSNEQIEADLDQKLAFAWKAREGKMQAEASAAGDRYVEQRAMDEARRAKQAYAAHAAVPQRVKNVFQAFDFVRRRLLLPRSHECPLLPAAARLMSPRARLRPLLSAQDGSGRLDYRELSAALRMYGIDVSAHGAAAVLGAYDANPDGQLDLVILARFSFGLV